MKNSYEFNIEDIMVASIKDLNSKEGFTCKFIRDISDPDNRFIECYEAQNAYYPGFAEVLCEKCGKWNKVDTDINGEPVSTDCPACSDDYKQYVDESYVIEQILSWFTEDIFYSCYIEINGEEIK